LKNPAEPASDTELFSHNYRHTVRFTRTERKREDFMKKLVLLIILSAVLSLCACDTKTNTELNALPQTDTTAEESDKTAPAADEIESGEAENNTDTETTAESAPEQDFTYTSLTWNEKTFIQINDDEPLVEDRFFDLPVPDFLTEEQQNLYRRAQVLYYLLTMCPAEIEQMPRNDGEDFSPEYPTLYLTVPGYDGFAGSFYRVNGRYSSWDDFTAMGLSVFTDGLFGELCQTNFFRINDNTYYLNSWKGSGYYYDDPALSFATVSSGDTEIKFEVIKHLERFPADESEAGAVLSLPVTMTLTDDGWRISEMGFTYTGEPVLRDEDACSAAMAEIYDTEKLVIDYVYECEKFTIIYGWQATGMKNGQRLWIVYPDGRYSDIIRNFDYSNHIRLTDFYVDEENSRLYCTDEQAELYPGNTVEYTVDIMTGEILQEILVTRTVIKSVW